jgi:hypothetical protein
MYEEFLVSTVHANLTNLNKQFDIINCEVHFSFSQAVDHATRSNVIKCFLGKKQTK